jgi:large subunit ribosomal protein L29
MKFSELKQKSKEELLKILEEKRGKLRALRFDLSLGKLKNVKEISKTKKEIARILTCLNQISKKLCQKENYKE